jgi:hypothetical protein
MPSNNQVLERTSSPAIGDVCHMETYAFKVFPNLLWYQPIPVQKEDVPYVRLFTNNFLEFHRVANPYTSILSR